jgi:hypothetical protein
MTYSKNDTIFISFIRRNNTSAALRRHTDFGQIPVIFGQKHAPYTLFDICALV